MRLEDECEFLYRLATSAQTTEVIKSATENQILAIAECLNNYELFCEFKELDFKTVTKLNKQLNLNIDRLQSFLIKNHKVVVAVIAHIFSKVVLAEFILFLINHVEDYESC